MENALGWDAGSVTLGSWEEDRGLGVQGSCGWEEVVHVQPHSQVTEGP